jgi:hypothetical protein
MTIDVSRFFGSWFALDHEVGHPEPGTGYAMVTIGGLLFLYKAGDWKEPSLMTSCFVPMAQHDAVHLLKRRSGSFRQEWERSVGSAS